MRPPPHPSKPLRRTILPAALGKSRPMTGRSSQSRTGCRRISRPTPVLWHLVHEKISSIIDRTLLETLVSGLVSSSFLKYSSRRTMHRCIVSLLWRQTLGEQKAVRKSSLIFTGTSASRRVFSSSFMPSVEGEPFSAFVISMYQLSHRFPCGSR